MGGTETECWTAAEKLSGSVVQHNPRGLKQNPELLGWGWVGQKESKQPLTLNRPTHAVCSQNGDRSTDVHTTRRGLKNVMLHKKPDAREDHMILLFSKTDGD